MSTQINLKKGFTLIELMVVIVIIGILAAIAIPKLFGMSAKAKAQEVGPAVGTFAKMQQAYKMETGHYGTTPEDISYKIPGGADAKATTGETGNFKYELEGGLALTATANFTSDPCKDGVWTASFSEDQSSEEPKVGITGDTNDGCKSLTPNYCNIGAKGTGTGACAD